MPFDPSTAQPWQPRSASPSPTSSTPAFDSASARLVKPTLPSPPATIENDEGSDLARGFTITLPQLKQTAGGALAFLGDVASRSDAVRALGGQGLAERVRDAGLEVYQSNAAAQEALAKPTDSFSYVFAHPTLPNVGAFLKYGAGYAAGQAAQTLAAAGIGALAGSEVPGVGNLAGAVGGLFAKKAVQNVVATQAEKLLARQIAQGVAKDAAEKAAAEYAKLALPKALARTGGAAAGAFGLNEAQELGAIYGEAREQAASGGRELSGADLARAGVASLGAAALDTAMEGVNVGALFRGMPRPTVPATTRLGAAASRAADVAKAAGAGAAREAATEAAQTQIERFGAGQTLVDAAAARDVIDSAALGAVGGGLVGGASGVHTRTTPTPVLPRPTVPYPNATPGSLSEAANTLATHAASAVPDAVPLRATAATSPPARDPTPAPLATAAPASPRTAPLVAPRVPPWVDTTTGEVRTPDDAQLRDELVRVMQQQYAADGSMRVSSPRLAQWWGVPEGRLKALRQQVLRERRGSSAPLDTATQTPDTPVLSEPAASSPTSGSDLAPVTPASPAVASAEANERAPATSSPETAASAERAAPLSQQTADSGVVAAVAPPSVEEAISSTAPRASSERFATGAVSTEPAAPASVSQDDVAPSTVLPDTAPSVSPSVAELRRDDQVTTVSPTTAAPRVAPPADAPAPAPIGRLAPFVSKAGEPLMVYTTPRKATVIVRRADVDNPALTHLPIYTSAGTAMTGASGRIARADLRPPRPVKDVRPRRAARAAAVAASAAPPAEPALPSATASASLAMAPTNDAPAMAAAPVSMAVSPAAAPAIEPSTVPATADATTPSPRVERAAAQAAASPANTLPEPTPAQQEAGNAKLGHVRLHGLDVSIQVPKGGTRRGTDKTGQSWERETSAHYGYLRRTRGADDEQVDVYLGPHAEDASKPVFVIDQVQPGTTRFDEHKVMLGFENGRAARRAYEANFPKGLKVFGGIRSMPLAAFKDWLGQGDLTHPVSNAVKPRREASVRVPPPAPHAPSSGELASVPDSRAAPSPIVDVGEKIGGARKDRWRERGLSVEDLAEMAGGEQSQYATKENVWPKIDYAARIAAGMEPQAAALLKIVRDRLAAKPRRDTNAGRRDYVEALSAVRETAQAVRTVADMEGFGRRVEDAFGIPASLGYVERMKPEMREKLARLFTLYKGRRSPFSVTSIEARSAARLVAAGWPAKAVPASPRARSDRKEEPARPHLDALERTGEDVRAGRDVGAEAFREAFGFRGVEFGNWAAQDERQRIVNLAFDALHDLAGVLGVPPKALSLNGTLGIAFAARGGGRFAAHYEGGKLVVNLTKLRGAGALAHEFGHALDHYFGELHRDDAYQGAPRGASGWYRQENYERSGKRLAHLRPELAAAFDRVMRALFRQQLTKAETIRDLELRVERAETAVRERGDVAKLALDHARQALAQTRATMGDNERTSGGRSSYAMEAVKLSGTSGSSGYWARPTEMFARAFEAFVFDQIAANDRVSDYLVHGVEAGRYDNPEKYRGDPYPKGRERDEINAAFRMLFDTIRSETTAEGTVRLFSTPAVASDPRSAGGGVTAARVRELVAAQTAAWGADAPKVEVVDTSDQLPAAAKTDPAYRTAEGFYDGATVHLVASNLRSEPRVQQVLTHEAVGHYGIDRIVEASVPGGWQRIVADIARLRREGRGSERMRGVFAEVERRYGAVDAATFAKETLAVMAERGVHNGLLARVIAAVRAFLRRWMPGLRFSETELRQLLVASDAYLRAATNADQRAARVRRGAFSTKDDPTQTAAFKHWFGNSTIVDEHGRPQVMYRGTSHPNAEAYNEKALIFLSPDQEFAEHYARGGKVHPLYVRAEHPFDASRGEGLHLWREFVRETSAEAWASQGTPRGALPYWTLEPQLRAWLDTKGVNYDAIWFAESNGSASLAVRDVRQLKSASDNIGTFDSASPNILFSQTPEATVDAIGAILRAGDGGVWAKAQEWLGGKWQDLKPALLGGLTLRHVLELLEHHLPGAKAYAALTQQMAADRSQLQEEGGAHAATWQAYAKKHPAENRTMSRLMHEATIAGVDPSAAYETLTFADARGARVPYSRVAVAARIKELRGQMRGRPGDDKTAMIDEVLSLRGMGQREKARRAAYPRLVARFAELSPAGQAVFRETRDRYQQQSDRLQAALEARIKDLKIPDAQKRTTIEMLRRQFEAARVDGVYFPLQRFGDYWIAGKDARGDDFFLMFEGYRDFARAEKNLRATGYTVTAIGRKDTNYKAKDAPPGTFVAEIIGQLKKSGAPDKVQDDIYQLYLCSLPELSTRKHSIHRKAVAGYSEDAMRAFAKNAFHGAHQLARLRYSHQLESTLERLQETADHRRQGDPITPAAANATDALLGELRRRHDWIMNPTDALWANAASAIGFSFYLGVTPAAALVNLTQPALTTIPVLGARFGFAKAGRRVLAAQRDAIRTWGNLDRTLTSDEERMAYNVLKQRGDIDKTLAHNLAGIGEGDALRSDPVYAKVMSGISALFQRAEIINREATGMAAFRLARADSMPFAQAVDYASVTIAGTQFDMSNQNRARFMQTPAAKAVLMFRQYALNMTWLFWRNVYQAFKGESAEVRRQAARTTAGIVGMSALFSGAMGLPWMGIASFIANAVMATFGDPDEPWDFNTEFRRFLAEYLGADAARILASGPANELGADIAGRVSLSSLWFREADKELEGQDLYYHLLEQAAGPMGGLVKNVLVGKKTIDEGHLYRGVETMLPKALKDAMKALRFQVEGVTTLKGDPIVEDLSAPAKVLQLLGFTPTPVSEQYRVNRVQKNYEQAVFDRRAHLIGAFAMAIKLGDGEARTQALEAIGAFNRKFPEIALAPASIRVSLQARARASAHTENGIVLNPKIAARAMGETASSERDST